MTSLAEGVALALGRDPALDLAGATSGPRLTSDWLCDLELVVSPPELHSLLGKCIHLWDFGFTEHLLSVMYEGDIREKSPADPYSHSLMGSTVT